MAERPRHITIGEAVSLTRPENFTYTPDDRQTLIQTMDGAIVEDYGWVAAGDKMSFAANFLWDEFMKIVGYFANRQKVKFVDMGGVEWPDCRVVVKSYTYIGYFENKAVKATLEIWRV